ncbi:PASTA domain-containing protein [Streptomyces sp. NPDC002078]
MPDLVGKNAEKAEEQLEKLGVPKSRIELRADDGNHVVVLVASNWDVNDQSVKAGARLGVKQTLVFGVGKPTCRERHHGRLLQPKRGAAQHFAPPGDRRGEGERLRWTSTW